MNAAIAKPPLVNVRYLLIGLIMLVAAGLALALTPREKVADQGAKLNLEAMIPKQFGAWRIDETLAPVQVSPDIKDRLDRIYSQTLSRTYINPEGQRVMLSIAYGNEQSRTLQVHRPEVCYGAQGFITRDLHKATLTIPGVVDVPVMRLTGTQGQRIEPITYWVRFGRDVVRGNLEQGFSRLRHGLRGEIPDGLLFRVSSISPDAEKAFAAQDAFVRDLITHSDTNTRVVLLGQR